MEYWESYSATLTVRGLCQPTAAWGLRWTTAGHWSSPSPTATDFRKVRSMCTVKTCFAWILTLNYTRSIVAWYYIHSPWLSAAPPDDRRSLSTGSRTPSPFGLASNASASSSPSPSSSSSSCSALETYSRKVFVGGLPPDIDQGQSNPPQLPPLVFRQ